ncbi:MAG: DUF3857 domain-containing protein [Deltaproteobacteria bacterium]|nr:DUF3857 domain-containing protein [Deltaproteobacteria bacterium]
MALALAWAHPAFAGDPGWESDPFAAAPAELLAAAEGPSPAGADVEVLLEHGAYAYDAEGRQSLRTVRVFRILTPAGISGWQSFGTSWLPSTDDAPTLRARVVTPAGQAYDLDPATIADSGADVRSSEQFDDSRVMRAPLPALQVGAVVVEERAVREHTPFFRGGRGSGWSFQLSVPVRHTRLELRSPKSHPLRWRAQRLEITPTTTKDGDEVVLTFDGGPTPALEDLPPALPHDAEGWPGVTWTTGTTWRDAARSYAEMIAPVLASTVSQADFAAAVGDAKGRDAIIARAAAYVQGNVRYTALNFGEGAIVPRTPEQTLARGYGDCKDKATLLVALLSRAGIRAHLALLQPGEGPDLRPDLPSLSPFSHAIVYIPGKPELWIDGTARDVPVGALPSGDQERLALIIAPDTKGLVLTPGSSVGEHWKRSRRVIRLSRSAPPELSFETTYGGSAAGSTLRAWCRERDPEEDRAQISRHLDSDFFGARLVSGPECEAPPALDEPVRRAYTATAPGIVATDASEDMEVTLVLTSLTSWLPDAWTQPPAAGPSGDEARQRDAAWLERPEDVELDVPHRVEVQYRIEPPIGMVAKDLPPSRTLPLGGGSLRERFEVTADGALEASFALETGPRRMSTAAAREAIEGVRAWLAEPMVRVTFAYAPLELERAGRIADALAALRSLAERDTATQLHTDHLVRILGEVGLPSIAREEAEKGTRLRPDDPAAHFLLGLARSNGAYGSEKIRGMDLEGATKAYRRALELDPTLSGVRLNLGLLLALGTDGVTFSPLADLDGAAEVLRGATDDAGRLQVAAALMAVLISAGRSAEAVKVAEGLELPASARQTRLAALAATQGLEAARQQAARWYPDADQRRAALDGAADFAVAARDYPLAAALVASSPSSSAEASARSTRVSTLQKTRRVDPTTLDPSEPCTPLWRALAELMGPASEASDEAILAQFATPTRSWYDGERPDGWFDRSTFAALRHKGISTPTNLDLTLSLGRCEVLETVGDAAQLELSISVGGQGPSRPWVVREKDGYRLVGDLQMRPFALMLRDRLQAGDLTAARAWAARARERLPRATPEVFEAILSGAWPTGDPLSEQELRLVDGLANIGDETATEVVGRVEEAATQESDPARRDALTAWRVVVLGGAERYDLALPLIEALRAAHPDDLSVIAYQAEHLFDAGRTDDAAALAREALARRDSDPYASRMSTLIALALKKGGDEPGYWSTLRQACERPSGSSSLCNDLAWRLTAVPGQGAEAARLALVANEKSRFASAATLDTLMVALAEHGDLAQAVAYGRSIAENGKRASPPSDEFVTARLAETYGYPDRAEAGYRRLLDAKGSGTILQALAERHLAALTAGGRATEGRAGPPATAPR